ncbi:helicase associated domain-containing protein [Streptomyces rishiriensis]|uniref:helicase associated domain-containing protein n=1 Tax=Streptomyces rishiriensis TaxID=68264 RepID=UPI0037D93EBD
MTTFNRLVHALADGQGLLGTAAQRRRRSSRPVPPFTPTAVLRPGETVMLDSTPLDVMVVLADGHIERIVGEDQEERGLKLGAWIGNQRSRAATLRPERVEQLSAIGMRWA